MGNIIRLPGDAHREAQLLLPWYLTERLDPEEHARVEAHLKTCAVCRADLRLEARLGAEFAGLPLEVDRGWAAMRLRLEDDKGRAAIRWPGAIAGWMLALARAGAPWMGWALAAGFAVVLAAGYVPTLRPAAPYHALSSAAAAPAGNVIVVFRPDASEAAMRAVLAASHARLVDGPTAAGAFVAHAPPAERERSLAALRADATVLLAEPIDDAGAR